MGVAEAGFLGGVVTVLFVEGIAYLILKSKYKVTKTGTTSPSGRSDRETHVK